MKINRLIILEMAALGLFPAVITLLSFTVHEEAAIDILGVRLRSLPIIEAAMFLGLLGLFLQFHSQVRLFMLIVLGVLCCFFSIAVTVAVNWLLGRDMNAGYLEAGLILLNALAAILTWLSVKFIVSYYRRNKFHQ